MIAMSTSVFTQIMNLAARSTPRMGSSLANGSKKLSTVVASLAIKLFNSLLSLDKTAVIRDGKLVNISLSEAEKIALENAAKAIGKAARGYLARKNAR